MQHFRKCQQYKDTNDYADKYRNLIHLCGIAFYVL